MIVLIQYPLPLLVLVKFVITKNHKIKYYFEAQSSNKGFLIHRKLPTVEVCHSLSPCRIFLQVCKKNLFRFMNICSGSGI